MRECSAVERIAERVTREMHAVEWQLSFKRGRLADAEWDGDEQAVAELRREVEKLEFEAGLHKLAVAITRGVTA